MEKVRVYDLPTRVFHILFAGLFIGAYFIVQVYDDESALYPYHMLLGIALVATVALRVIWGVIGSRYARFTSLSLGPKALLGYFRDIVTGKLTRSMGHNPASSWAAIVMMILAVGLGVTGYMMTQSGSGEVFEEVHELMANTFIVVVIAHVAGVILHTLRHRDGIGMSMIHGKKNPVGGAPGISHPHTIAGLTFLGVIGVFVFHLNKNYDPATQSLALFGSTYQLGESENEGSGDERKNNDAGPSDHDNDGDDD